ILDVISPLEENGTLAKRSRELLEAEIEQFTVIERDTMIIGCAALYPFDSSEKTGELACVAIHPNFRDGKRGSMLLNHIERQASRYGLNTLFVLTTQTEHWFLEHGFVKSSANELPESRKSLYNFQRNSKVFKKPVIR
ncbi:MAG TPA: GNAT family N-acetyltransferase, partial [Pseudomonadales bacterium]